MLSRYQSSTHPDIYSSAQHNRESNISYVSQEDGRVAVRKNFVESLQSAFEASRVANIGLISLSLLKIAATVLVIFIEDIHDISTDSAPSDVQYNIGAKEIGFWLILGVVYDILQIFYLMYLTKVIKTFKQAAGSLSSGNDQNQQYNQQQQQNTHIFLPLLEHFQDNDEENSIPHRSSNISRDEHNQLPSIQIPPSNDNNNNNPLNNQMNTQNVNSLDSQNNNNRGFRNRNNIPLFHHGINVTMLNSDNNNNDGLLEERARRQRKQINITEFLQAKDQVLRHSERALKIFYCGLFIIGNYLAYMHKDSLNTYPKHFYLLIWLLALGYFTFGIQILLLISICLCFPLTLFLYLLMRNRTTKTHSPTAQSILDQLTPIVYGEKQHLCEFESQKECCICLVEYAPQDKILSLPCSKMHHFHYDCVVKWLQINGVCPICKQSLDPFFEELKDQKLQDN